MTQLKTKVIKLSPIDTQGSIILQDMRTIVNLFKGPKRLSLLAQILDIEATAIAARGEFNKKTISRLHLLSQEIEHNRFYYL